MWRLLDIKASIPVSFHFGYLVYLIISPEKVRTSPKSYHSYVKSHTGGESEIVSHPVPRGNHLKGSESTHYNSFLEQNHTQKEKLSVTYNLLHFQALYILFEITQWKAVEA